MSKYVPLWEWVKNENEDSITLSFEEIQNVLVFAIDYSFLNSKKDLQNDGYEVPQFSLKEKCVCFKKSENEER